MSDNKTTKQLQEEISKCFSDNFGYTSLNERLNDIQKIFFRLMKYKDVKNLKEESGYLLTSLIQLYNESDWNISESVEKTLEVIESRSLQYKSLGRKTKVALLGGAFNPITLGHIQLAQFVLNTSGQFDEVWIMPTYNHMYNKKMLSPEQRLEMCRLVANVDRRIKVFDYEIKNQLSGETFYLFKRLLQEKELVDKYDFSLIIGLDNANTFDKWVNYEELERLAKFVIVPRKGYKRDESVDWYLKPPHIFLNTETDIIEISSTDIRNMIVDGDENVFKYLNSDVYKYIIDNNLYKE